MHSDEVSELQAAIREAASKAWQHLQENFGDQTFYGFALYTSGPCQYILCTAFSEEGLAEVLAEYGDRSTEQDLRFSGPDSPLHLHGEEFFIDVVDPLLDDGYLDDEDDDVTDREVRRRFDACFGALAQLEEQGLFAGVINRDRFVLNVLQGDQSHNSMMENARRLNPSKAIDWLEGFLEVTSNIDAIAAVGDGSVYQADALAVSGNRVLVAAGAVQQVDFVAPNNFRPRSEFGTRINALSIAPDGDSVWMCRGRVLARTSMADPSVGDVMFELNSKGFFVAVSPNGERIVAASSRQLEMFTASGEKLWTSATNSLHPRCAWHPESGALLCVGDDGGGWIDPETGSDFEVVDARPKGTACVISPDGTLAAFGFGDDYDDDGSTVVAIYEMERNKLVWESKLRGVWSIADLSFNSQNWLVAGTSAGPMYVFDNRGVLVGTVQCRLESISAVEWVSADVFVACGRDVDTGPPALAFSVSALTAAGR